MTINDAFPSKYLKASDLPEEGSQTFTIEKIEIEEIGKDKQKKPVVYFVEDHKGLVLNKTNARTIAKILDSDDFEDWTGKAINLYRAEVQFVDDIVEAIRVKRGLGKFVDLNQPKAVDHEEDIPF